jgi:predicted O-methyltransferase YrrM
LLLWQSENGISGDAAEIGVFLGRSAIALALALQPHDRFLAIDKFTWPDNALVRFQNYARRYGVVERALVCKAIDTTALSSESFVRETGIGKLRYFHIDGDHSPSVLRHDLSLAVTSMVDRGVICLDDMLHPLYPELQVVVNGFLRDHDELRGLLHYR